ncbi:MAG: sortase [Acetobacter sp.]|nr:sortase [Bacteroides sp.]MCM1341112.1 sortase [Acetobacter sp.]MCM1433554.1 sortase [Clostridiales bacterium]
MSDKKRKGIKKTVGTVYILRIVIFVVIAVAVTASAIIIALPYGTGIVHKVEGKFPMKSRDVVISETIVSADNAKYGEKIASISSDDFGLNCDVYYGSNRASMRYGAGWSKESGNPGGSRTCLISGNGETYFSPLHSATAGDIINVKTADNSFSYKVFDTKYIDINKQAYNENDDGILVICSAESSFSPHSRESFYVFAKLINGEVD